MLRLISFSLCATLLFTSLTFSAQKKKDYLTEDELDLIREAQDIGPRIDAYLRLAKRRLIVLRLTEKSQKDIDQEKEEQAEYDLAKAHVGADSDVLKPVTDFAYLNNFSDAELLRGYIQAVDESMTNIDDFYERKDDVRGAVETLEKFTADSIPLLQKYKPKDAADKAALQDALAKAKEANDGAKAALKVVPKTEKRPPR
jgi:hypothetical protein